MGDARNGLLHFRLTPDRAACTVREQAASIALRGKQFPKMQPTANARARRRALSAMPSASPASFCLSTLDLHVRRSAYTRQCDTAERGRI